MRFDFGALYGQRPTSTTPCTTRAPTSACSPRGTRRDRTMAWTWAFLSAPIASGSATSTTSPGAARRLHLDLDRPRPRRQASVPPRAVQLVRRVQDGHHQPGGGDATPTSREMEVIGWRETNYGAARPRGRHLPLVAGRFLGRRVPDRDLPDRQAASGPSRSSPRAPRRASSSTRASTWA